MFGGGAALVALTLSACTHAPPKPTAEALTATEQCESALERARYDDADAACDRALSSSPQYAPAWAGKGSALLARGKPAEAHLAFKKALSLEPRNARALNGEGIVAFADKRYPEAEKLFRDALSVRAEFPQARYNLALTRHLVDDNDSAKRELKALLEKSPKYPDGWHLNAVIGWEERRYRDALQAAMEAIHLDPTVSAFWLTLGDIYAATYRYEDAEYAFTSCLDIDPREEDCRRARNDVKDRMEPIPPRLRAPRF